MKWISYSTYRPASEGVSSSLIGQHKPVGDPDIPFRGWGA